MCGATVKVGAGESVHVWVCTCGCVLVGVYVWVCTCGCVLVDAYSARPDTCIVQCCWTWMHAFRV